MLDRLLNEGDLAAFAAAFAGNSLTAAEQALLPRRCSPMAVSIVERQALASDPKKGIDHLGRVFTALRSPEIRRDNGATYTPSAIVTTMVEWARSQDVTPVRIVDAGAGSGRYAIAAAQALDRKSVV